MSWIDPLTPMYATSSKTLFSSSSRAPSPVEWSDENSFDSPANSDFSPTILCAECLHTFACSEQACDPSTLSKVRAKYVPLPSEIAKIQLFIDDLDKDLSKYDLEIKRLEGTLKRLTRQRDALGRRRDECEALLSPIRRLPPEILSQVFHYHCQRAPISFEGRNSIRLPKNLVVDAPALTISHVCSFWRELSLSVPVLWSSLQIDLRWYMGYGPTRLFHSFLTYTGSTPLDLQVTFGYGDANNAAVLDSLVDLSHRWHTVAWECAGGPGDTMNYLAPKGFPLLTSLTLKYGYLSNLCFFQGSNSLQHLALDDVGFSTDGLTLPFTQLSTISITEQYTSQTLFLLQKFSTSLESAEIKYCLHSSPQVLDHYAVQLNHLTSLMLSTSDFQEILGHITTPKLTSLTITSNHAQYGSPITFLLRVDAFLEFLSRSSLDGVNVLEQLKLDRVELSDSGLLRILRLTPKLKCLSVRDDIFHWSDEPQDLPTGRSPRTEGLITNSFLRSLTVTHHIWGLSSVLVPEIHTLDFVTHPSRIDNGLLVDMIASRSQSDLGISPLRNVSVRQGEWPGAEPDTHFARPLVTLEPVMLIDLDDSEEGSMGTAGLDTSGPDPSLMSEDEIAFRKGTLRLDLENTESDVRNDSGEEGIITKVKDRALKCLWWGGSIATPDFSFVRLVSALI